MNNIASFTQQPERYAQHRPTYPPELFAYLSSLVKDHERAWDCATGSGQAAVGSAPFFSRIQATDLSEEQVQHAARRPNIDYLVCSAEKPPFQRASFDLISVAQAIHWFNFSIFYTEVRRVLKPGGVLAAWGYGFFSIEPKTDQVIADHLLAVIDRYWAAGNRLIMAGYTTLPFPLDGIPNPPNFTLHLPWNRQQLLDYLSTWSAVKRCQIETGANPLDGLLTELESAWGDPDEQRIVHMPIYLKAGRV